MNLGSALFLSALLILAATIAYFVLSDPGSKVAPVAESPPAVQQPAEQVVEAPSGGQAEPGPTAAQPQGPAEPSAAEEPSGDAPQQEATGLGTETARQAAEEKSAAAPAPKQPDTAQAPAAEPAPEEAPGAAPDDVPDDMPDDVPGDLSDNAAGRTSDSDPQPLAEQRRDDEQAAGAEEEPSEPQSQIAALPKPKEKAPEAKPEPQVSFDVVRIARDGALVAAGRSPSGSRVFLLRDGKVEAEAEADRQGNWVLILDEPLPPGDYELSLEAWLPSGEKIRSPDLVIASVPRPVTEDERPASESDQQQAERQDQPAAETDMADKTAPAAETETAAVSDEPVAIAVPKEGGGARVLQGGREPEGEGISTAGLSLLSVDYDATGFIKVAGRGRPDATILAYLDNSAIGRTQVGTDERWLIAPERAVEEGIYRLRVDQLDSEGEVIARLETVFARTIFIADLPRDRMVVVQPGNSLWRLARRLYGEGILYSVIYDANKDQIRDPDLIYPGQIFIAPPEN